MKLICIIDKKCNVFISLRLNMSHIHQQLKQRRKELGLKQNDMPMLVGMARQQYQRLEAGGNPQLDNLELVAKGLKLELILVPQEKLQAVKSILEGSKYADIQMESAQEIINTLVDNPWKNIFSEET
jgi:transcriptional regulator with XRE-family HTH domain